MIILLLVTSYHQIGDKMCTISYMKILPKQYCILLREEKKFRTVLPFSGIASHNS